MKNCNFKIRFSRTTKKADCISVKGVKDQRCGMTCLLILSCAIRFINKKKCTKHYSCIDMKYELIALVSWLRVIYVYYFIFVLNTTPFWVVKT